MHNSECYIRDAISKVASFGNPIKPICNDIKLAYFHGYIDISTYNELLAELTIADKTYEFTRKKQHDEFERKQKIALDNYRNRHKNA